MLAALAAMAPNERAIAEKILHRHEEHAATNSELNEGCSALLHWIAARQIPIALITNNSRTSVTTVLARHALSFHVLITRDDGPFKPDPAPLLLACAKLNVAPKDVWMIGDGQYDVEAGTAAGIATIWISHNQPKPFAAEPWMTAKHLEELLHVLQRCKTV
jgi:HAD superfamily hydrolase (TIGR01549 family)